MSSSEEDSYVVDIVETHDDSGLGGETTESETEDTEITTLEKTMKGLDISISEPIDDDWTVTFGKGIKVEGGAPPTEMKFQEMPFEERIKEFEKALKAGGNEIVSSKVVKVKDVFPDIYTDRASSKRTELTAKDIVQTEEDKLFELIPTEVQEIIREDRKNALKRQEEEAELQLAREREAETNPGKFKMRKRLQDKLKRKKNR